MTRDAALTTKLKTVFSQLMSLTKSGELTWERQTGSAHRYARWKNNLLILGPADPSTQTSVPRYLFITPFDSPACVEVNSEDPELGQAVSNLVKLVEEHTRQQNPTDPFALTDEVLGRLD